MKKLNATTAYLIRCVISALCSGLIFTALSAYYVRNVGMNPLQLVLVGTAIETTCFLFEVPTGIVADMYSRRLSVIIGGFLIGICYLLTGLVPVFLAIIVAEIIRGIGETFISGAADAWITDEVGSDQIGHVFLRGSQASQVGGLLGVLLSVGLASWFDYKTPILLGGALWIGLSLLSILIMPETAFTPTPRGERTHIQSMVHTLGEGLHLVRRTPVLIVLLLGEILYGAFSEGFDRLWEAHFLTNLNMPVLSLPVIGKLDPIAWFGVFSVILTITGLISAEIVRRRVNLNDHNTVARTLVVFYAFVMAGVIGLGLAHNFGWAVIAFLVANQFRGLAGPVISTWLNQNINSNVRATVLSLNSQSNALGQIAGGPGVGALGKTYGIRAALTLSGVLLLPLLALYARTINRHAPVMAETEEVVLPQTHP
ncbi:MAG: MFS transporter [Caldilineaceae bacterium]